MSTLVQALHRSQCCVATRIQVVLGRPQHVCSFIGQDNTVYVFNGRTGKMKIANFVDQRAEDWQPFRPKVEKLRDWGTIKFAMDINAKLRKQKKAARDKAKATGQG